MLSATSEYALRAVMVMAREYGQPPMRADVIATATGSPRNYMAKTLNALVKSGLALSTRGPQGGFQLAAPPESLTVADVIDAFDEPRNNRHCLLGNTECDGTVPCAVHMRWTAIESARREPLANTTLAELLGDHSHVVHPHLHENTFHATHSA